MIHPLTILYSQLYNGVHSLWIINNYINQISICMYIYLFTSSIYLHIYLVINSINEPLQLGTVASCQTRWRFAAGGGRGCSIGACPCRGDPSHDVECPGPHCPSHLWAGSACQWSKELEVYEVFEVWRVLFDVWLDCLVNQCRGFVSTFISNGWRKRSFEALSNFRAVTAPFVGRILPWEFLLLFAALALILMYHVISPECWLYFLA